MPANVGESASLANKVVNEQVGGLAQSPIKNRRIRQPVKTFRLGMAYAVDLCNSALQRKIELPSNPACENPGNRIHSGGFHSMNRKQLGTRISDKSSD